MSNNYFSRPGRACTSRFKILLEKESLLSNSPKSKTQSIPSFVFKDEPYKPIPPQEIERLIQQEIRTLNEVIFYRGK